LSNAYNKLWVFGDSFTTPGYCVEPRNSFWGLAAAHCGIPVIQNCSRQVNSFDSVCQLLIGQQAQYNWTQDLFIIGIPPLERITVEDNRSQYHGTQIDTGTWQQEDFEIPALQGLTSLQFYGSDTNLIIHTARTWVETQALRTVFLLTAWLDSVHAHYVIVNLSQPFFEQGGGPNEFLVPYAVNHSRCILFKDTYRSINQDRNPPADFDQYGWTGHHGPAGNRCFFEESLLPTMKRNALC